MKDEKNRILRWHENKFLAYGKENKGKIITDTNPYIKIKPEAFDLYTEIDPPRVHPDTFLYKKEMLKFMNDEKTPRLKKTFIKYIPGLIKGAYLEKIQYKKNDKVKVRQFTDKQKLVLKKQILKELKKYDLIGGFTLIDRRYINEESENIFPYDTILIIGAEMTKDSIMEIPHPTSVSDKIFDFDVYHSGGLIVDKIATFIRSKGVKCLSHIPFKWDINYTPHAINAGMGNYSTHGLMLTEKWGTRLRLYAISIDLDIPIDKPQDLNFEEFCKRCRMCYKSCPSKAIPKDEDEYSGAIKRRVSMKRCGASMSTNKFCGVCLKVCPFNNFEYDKLINTLPKYYQYNTLDKRSL
ncbi:hypothetical protein AN639_06295 [Candidatus Epulonipiscium fishelsonii]|uniref:Uncharacterized protein n=1 Tax=Candidatus Epulonipiscium fishelsonii TaxID=77094 RepID=A0ACC8XAX0_9FIRM|nr:hypothetical protein AN639_06295 [Epulopiscium sp. SCG-B05WGA-EpuloA1]ONI39479.1 hypothetical protein AN396_08740 [Epulopiscium sp. SCG-B11WGA-EpuloA1]